jgi:hypothetical protein
VTFAVGTITLCTGICRSTTGLDSRIIETVPKPITLDISGEGLLFIDCEASGVPTEVVTEALCFAAATTPSCKSCDGTCDCGAYQRNMLAKVARRIWCWLNFQNLSEHERVKMPFQSRVILSRLSTDWQTQSMLQDGSRRPESRRPEENGFEIDHVEGNRWCRFKNRS